MRIRLVTRGTLPAVDAAVVGLALYGAYAIRFDFSPLPVYMEQLVRMLPIVLLVRMSALYYSRCYQFLWRYAGLMDLVRVVQATAVGLVFLAVVNYFRNYPLGLLIAGSFFISALLHREFLQMRSRLQLRRLLMWLAMWASGLLLVLGLAMYTVLRSAPKNVVDLPLGSWLAQFDFPFDLSMPRGALVMESVLSLILLSGVRIAPRVVAELMARGRQNGRRALIYGAGDLGESIVRALRKDPGLGHAAVGLVDDDPAKLGASIHGVRVLGRRADLGALIQAHRVTELLIAISDLSDEVLRELAAVCWQRRVRVSRVPSLASMVDPALGLRNLESVDIQELLGRAEISLDQERVRLYLQDRVVLVTGAGGSIGGELCRQIARCQPAQLLLLGKGENSIYLIEKELGERYPELRITSLIADIKAPSKMEFVFSRHRPAVVFHAAAYKHVPFMEDSPEEAVLNNVFGTRTVAEAALRHGCERFVMISSDKAVKPSSVMGTTKRIAEMVLHELAAKSAAAGGGHTRFVTVRFGNVLRSRGSVIPLFERQIAAGGPVTVTHPEMRRFFMSIPEAVRLVLHSGAIGGNGDLCILDMGEQVRIVDLAENMIRQAGKVPYEDIDVEFTGIRAGEKLYEELFTEAEARTLRKVDKIFVCRPDQCGCEALRGLLPELRVAAMSCRRRELTGLLQRVVPTYIPTPATSGLSRLVGEAAASVAGAAAD